MIAFSKSLKNKLSMIYVFKEKIKPAVNSLKAFRNYVSEHEHFIQENLRSFLFIKHILGKIIHTRK